KSLFIPCHGGDVCHRQRNRTRSYRGIGAGRNWSQGSTRERNAKSENGAQAEKPARGGADATANRRGPSKGAGKATRRHEGWGKSGKPIGEPTARLLGASTESSAAQSDWSLMLPQRWHRLFLFCFGTRGGRRRSVQMEYHN